MTTTDHQPEASMVTCDVSDDGVLTVTLDDGDKNALTPASFTALIAALDDHPDARGVLLTGRDGILTAGLDVQWMADAGRDGVRDLLHVFGEALLRWWTDPRPTVCAAPGHAIAAGTMFAMACDYAVAAEGGWWGLMEVRIDFEVPDFGLALARANVRADRFEDLILAGERVDAAAAVEVGYADVTVPAEQVLDTAQRRLKVLMELPPRAYAGTKARLRAAAAEQVRAGLAADATAVTAHLEP